MRSPFADIKKVAALCALVVSVILSQPAAALDFPPWAPANVSAPVGYTLAFDDEFNDLDMACFYWGKLAGQHRWYEIANVGVAPQMPCAPGASQISVESGSLVITLANVGGKWVSGGMQTMAPSREGQAWSKAYYEARIKLPSATPAGLDVWPAFWTNGRWTAPAYVPGAAYTMPTSDYAFTEIDGMEARLSWGANNIITAWQHPSNPATTALPKDVGISYKPPFIPFDDKWHTYGILVDPNGQVCVYLDSIQQACIAASALDLSHPMYAILGLEAFSSATSPLPDPNGPAVTYKMYVDYVRVYAPAQ